MLLSGKNELVDKLLDKNIYICINFYSYSRIGTDDNNMKIKTWTVMLTTIRKARNHCLSVCMKTTVSTTLG